MADRRYYACAFPNSDRTYTYHYDGEELAAEDRVEVETNHGKTVLEVRRNVPKPSFPTKAIIGKAPKR